MTEVSSQNPPAAPPVPVESVGTTAAAVDAIDAPRPAWLAPKQPPVANVAAKPAESKPVRGRRRRVIRIETSDDEPTNWKQNIVRSIIGGLGVGFGVSMLLHIVAIVGFAFWVLDLDKLLPEFVINAGVENPGVEVKLDTTMPIELAQKAGGPPVQESKLFNPNEFIPPNLEIDTEIPADLENRINELAAKDAGTGNAKGKGAAESDSPSGKRGTGVGRNAVSKGKFTVWSEPPNPDVEQSYRIGIRVEIPKDVKKFRVNDLSGSVSGDLDGHRQNIPHDLKWGPPKVYYRGKYINLRKTGFVPVHTRGGKKYATIYIWVPGSQVPKTTDTVQIRSKLLKESQSLKIEF